MPHIEAAPTAPHAERHIDISTCSSQDLAAFLLVDIPRKDEAQHEEWHERTLVLVGAFVTALTAMRDRFGVALEASSVQGVGSIDWMVAIVNGEMAAGFDLSPEAVDLRRCLEQIPGFTVEMKPQPSNVVEKHCFLVLQAAKRARLVG